MGGDYNANQKKKALALDAEDVERPTKKKGGIKKKFPIYSRWTGAFRHMGRGSSWTVWKSYETEKKRLEAFKNLNKKERSLSYMEFSLTNPDEEDLNESK